LLWVTETAKLTKFETSETLTGPMLTHGSEYPLSKKDENMIQIFERIMLRMNYGPINNNGTWKIRHNGKLYTLYNEPDIVKVVKTGRLRWLGHLFRMQELNHCSKITLLKPNGTQCVGKTEVEEDLINMGIWNWEQKSQN
jgi:hypothetical protein